MTKQQMDGGSGYDTLAVTCGFLLNIRSNIGSIFIIEQYLTWSKANIGLTSCFYIWNSPIPVKWRAPQCWLFSRLAAYVKMTEQQMDGGSGYDTLAVTCGFLLNIRSNIGSILIFGQYLTWSKANIGLTSCFFFIKYVLRLGLFIGFTPCFMFCIRYDV